MKRHFLIHPLALLMVGCGSIGNHVTSRSEFESFVSRHPHHNSNWYYCGTDTANHHFITRIGGNTSTFMVPKEEIKLTKTVPLPPPGMITIHQVDPSDNFAFGEETKQWHYLH